MTTPSSTPAPTFEVIGGEPTDAAISALARLLLSLRDDDDETEDQEQTG